MKMQKKNILVVVIIIVALSLTSFYFFTNKPKTSKFTKAKLVFENSVINELGK